MTGMNAMEWLEQVRGLDVELCSEMGFREVTLKGLGVAVAWPFVRNGEAYAHKARPLEDKTFRWHPKGIEHGLFNEDALRNPHLSDQPVVICEGEFDAVSCIMAGFRRTVSIPDGWTEGAEDPGSQRMKAITAVEDLIAAAPKIIVAADADGPGQSFARAVSALFDSSPVLLASWPEGCKDANDVLRRHGEGALSRCLNQAKIMDPPGGVISGFSDLPPMPDRAIYRIGYDPFDQCLAFEQCAMSVCTGIPGSGKSTFLRWAAHQMIRNHGIRVGAVEFENDAHAIRDHLARMNTGRPWSDLSGAERDDLVARLDRSWRLAQRAPDGEIAENLEWLRARIHALSVRDGCRLIYVDPWNELEHLPEPGESMTSYLNFAIKKIRQWAERYECHVCIVAHPRKIHMDAHGRVRIPEGYDVADSAAWANKPALGFSVHQTTKNEEPVVKVRTWKVRNVQAYGFGRTTISVDFDTEAMAYRRRA